MLSDEVRPNHFHEPPELFLNGDSADKRVKWMMSRLRGGGTAKARLTIMIAEGERDILSWMRRTLVDMGYRVVKAEDPEEAPEVGRRERPGLILTNTDLVRLGELIGLMSHEAGLRFVPVASVYPDMPEEFRDDGLRVLDDYSRLEGLISAKGAGAS